MTILLAEDNEDLREAFTSTLENMGHKVIACVDGEQALEEFQCNQVDIIITDYEMPKSNGFAFALGVRQFNQNIPIFVCSGRSVEELNVIFREVKVQGIFEKVAFRNLVEGL